MGAGGEQIGLRERKKQRTRAALVDAALDLFAANGYDATTVEGIAAAVEVSPRTFFRYFEGKEDVALAPVAELDQLVLAGLTRRPAEEPPLTALRAAYRAMLDHLTAPDRTALTRYLTVHHLVQVTPALLAGSLRRQADGERLIAAEIAGRAGVSEADLRPRLLVRLVLAGARVGFETGCQRGVLTDPALLVATVEEALDLATAGIPERWGPPWR
ncbi:TetR family transcriptional regulator [Streptoalloteichus hindustanus]|uniref:Transcriptional regulator, TetR family n=1 Tax=Streptoalloteichus hindustanus TaxID=2017 RepID=A0A1M5PGK5_STRHI|nr:TetR family transcriptional regulator [Streptoalloteichus hindustanus]SHH00413.1 transcriptional regulator, TetR family [Streptoalloteichus hindustanus]